MPSSDPGTDSDHQRARILWVEEEHAIMAEKLGTFRAKDRTKEERRKIVQKVCKAIKLFNSSLTDAEWVLKKKVRLPSIISLLLLHIIYLGGEGLDVQQWTTAEG